MDALRTMLDELAADVPALGDLDRAIEQVERERRRRTGMIVSILAAAAAAVLVVGLVTRGGVPADPEPAPAPPGPVMPSGQEAVVLRGSTLIAVDTTGHERRMLDLFDLGVSEDGLEYPYVSSAGWLSTSREVDETSTDGDYELYDLTHPRTPPRTGAYTFMNRAWSPDGTKLAGTAYPPSRLEVIDATTGDRQILDDVDQWVLPGGGPEVIWSIDPPGLLVTRAGAVRDDGQGDKDPYTWGVLPADGSPLIKSNDLPSLDHRISRYVVRGGRHVVCNDFLRYGCSEEDIVVRDTDGTITTLYDGPSGSALWDSTLSFDGRAAYLLRSAGPAAPNVVEVVRAEADTDPQVLTTIQIPAPTGPDDRLSMNHVTTDDSAVILSTGFSPGALSYLVPLDGSQAHPLPGRMIGWMPTAAVDAVIAANR